MFKFKGDGSIYAQSRNADAPARGVERDGGGVGRGALAARPHRRGPRVHGA